MAAGTAGGFYDLSEHAVVSRLNGQADTALKPGMGVVQGDKPGSNVKIPATGATLDQFEGIVINDVNREMNMDGELLIQPKTTKNTQGVQAMNLKKGQRLLRVQLYEEGMLQNPNRYKKNLPALGALPEAGESAGEQLKL